MGINFNLKIIESHLTLLSFFKHLFFNTRLCTLFLRDEILGSTNDYVTKKLGTAFLAETEDRKDITMYVHQTCYPIGQWLQKGKFIISLQSYHRILQKIVSSVFLIYSSWKILKKKYPKLFKIKFTQSSSHFRKMSHLA